MLLMNVSSYLAKYLYVVYICVHAFTSCDSSVQICNVDINKIYILCNNVTM